ncbi:MAG: hypothetical protein JNJ76_03830, partial [Candidatus Competibacter sp.]|nr:hypothetical protein [Candidatus Competibacter sp.]
LLTARQADSALQLGLGGGRFDLPGIDLDRRFVWRRCVRSRRHNFPREFVRLALRPPCGIFRRFRLYADQRQQRQRDANG